MFEIMFVCTGNICRSSMAEGLMKALVKEAGLDKKIRVTSSGTSVFYPMPASGNAVEALEEIGIDISDHISRPIVPELIEDSDLVLCMTRAHKNCAVNVLPRGKDKIYTLIEYANNGAGGDVEDPYMEDLDVYRMIRDEISDYLKPVLERIKKKL